MILGFYGLYFELSNPGAIFPGVAGAICLILAFYALQTLPINYAGLMLIMLAIGLFIAEAFITSHGVLGVGGAHRHGHRLRHADRFSRSLPSASPGP